jgi:CRISPR-associated endonuclease/helicase Cas3
MNVATAPSTTALDLAFRLTGSRLPVDHGYALYAAICRVLPEIHAARDIGIHPVRGRYVGDAALQLSRPSRLVFRLPAGRIGAVLGLVGQVLDVDGYRLGVGVPEVRPLHPAPTLRARLVTIKGFMEPDPFLQAVRRQLAALNIDAPLRVGRRRTVRVNDRLVVGFELAVGALGAQASLALQGVGVGGRRRMGCGVFVAAPSWGAS